MKTIIFLLMTLLFLLFLISFSNILLVWLFMTMLSMLMLMMISKTENKLKYFLIQETSVLSMMFFIFKNTKSWIILPLFLKMGMTPLHTWMLEIFIQSMKTEMILFVSLAKIMPAILIMSFLNINILIFLLVIFLFSQMFPLVYQNNMKSIIFFSSLINFILMFILSFNFFNTSFMLSIIYLIFIIFIFPNIKNFNLNQVSTVLIFLLAGIPISPIFFMKIFLYFMLSSLSIFFLLIVTSSLFYFIYISMYLNTMKNNEVSNHVVSINSSLKNFLFFLLFVFIIVI